MSIKFSLQNDQLSQLIKIMLKDFKLKKQQKFALKKNTAASSNKTVNKCIICDAIINQHINFFFIHLK